MGKNPAFLMYPSDWQRDLDEHPLEIEGAWIRICCRMWWAPQRGRLTFSLARWATILRKDENCTNRIIDYLLNEKISSGQREANGYITLVSRRMMKDEKERDFNRLRQRKFRNKEDSNADITQLSRKRHVPSSVSVTASVTDTKNKKKLNKEKKIFRIPSLEEVTAYCKERNNDVNPQKWIAHYVSNGWKVGKNKMVDWKAAIITWEGGNNGSGSRVDTSQRTPAPETGRAKSDEAEYPVDGEY